MSTIDKIIEEINSKIDTIDAQREELMQAIYLWSCLDTPNKNVPYEHLVHWHSNSYEQGEDVLIDSFVNKFANTKKGVTYEIICERIDSDSWFDSDSWLVKLCKTKQEKKTETINANYAFRYSDLNNIHEEFIKLICDDINKPDPKVIHITSIDDLKKYKDAIASPEIQTIVYANSIELVAACYALRTSGDDLVTIIHTPSNTIIENINL